MAAQEATTQRAVFVDTSNEPRTDEEAVSMCTRGLAKATARQDIADLQFRLANAQVRRGFPDLAEAAFRACVVADPVNGYEMFSKLSPGSAEHNFAGTGRGQG